MVYYRNAKIYKLCSSHTDKVYVGSTCERLLCMRFSGHRRSYRHWQKGKYRFVSSFDIIKYPDAYIELVESYPCNNKDELRQREGYWIKQLDCVNRRIEGRSMKQYRIDNKKQIQEKRNVKTDCPCGGRYTHPNKAKHMKSKKHQKYRTTID